jgi:hypothetical protein
MHISPATTPAHQYNGPAKLAADNDGDGRKGAAALNDGDAAARIATRALAQSGSTTQGSQAPASSDNPAVQQNAVNLKA